ncbi:phosphotransferase family protein [Oceanobacillus longus]|uniref:Phosphotransferase family protein n=1 Tax=Oceanobacillus longus TaxID=930120 RepID=A0ABV8GWW1_9BACI
MINKNLKTNEVINVREDEQIDPKAVESYLRNAIKDLPKGRLEVFQFSTGSSNLTYLLKIKDWEGVLRRAPKGPINEKAHDMQREYKVLKALHPVFPLAPKVYVFSGVSDIVGAPFYIMEKRKGHLLDNILAADNHHNEKEFRDISNALVETLVELHSIDYRKTELVHMTKPEGFLLRQVKGWIKRYENVKLIEKMEVEQLKKWLLNNLPESQDSTIIHYDYHLSNMLFDSENPEEMTSLLDWEMSTVGDPLTDLASAMVYWIEDTDSDDYKKIRNYPITTKPGFYTRREFIESYAKKSGRNIEQMNYYMAFAYFKNLVIAQQIYFRWKKEYTTDERFKNGDVTVDLFLNLALEHIRRNCRDG